MFTAPYTLRYENGEEQIVSSIREAYSLWSNDLEVKEVSDSRGTKIPEDILEELAL